MQLRVGLLQLRDVPQAQVVDSGLVVLDVLQSELGAARVLADLDVLEVERQARVGQLAGDVGRLAGELLWRDDEPLHGFRVARAQDPEHDPNRERDHGQPEPPKSGVDHQRDGQKDAEPGRDVSDRDARVDVGITGAPDVAVVRVEDVVAADERARGNDQGDHRQQQRDVRHAAVGQAELEVGVTPGVEGGDQQHGQEGQAQRPAQDGVDEGQGEEIEGDVGVEDGLGLAGRRAV